MKTITYFLSAPLVLFLLLTSATHSTAQTTCFQVVNFSSVCVKPTAPRKLTLTFKVIANQPGTSVLVSPAPGTGTFNNQPSLTIPLVANQANVSVTYDEVTPNTTVNLILVLLNGSNTVCRMMSTQTLVVCGNNCGTMTMSVNNMQGGVSPAGSSNAYTGPMVTLFGGVIAGPEKVTQLKTVFTSMQRRTKCVGAAPGPYQNVALTPLALTQGYVANGLTVTSNYNPPMDYTAPKDFTHNLGNLPPKLNPACPEEFQIVIQVTVTFANGCTKTQSVTVTVQRP